VGGFEEMNVCKIGAGGATLWSLVCSFLLVEIAVRVRRMSHKDGACLLVSETLYSMLLMKKA
jgi:hypothetical protein